MKVLMPFIPEEKLLLILRKNLLEVISVKKSFQRIINDDEKVT